MQRERGPTRISSRGKKQDLGKKKQHVNFSSVNAAFEPQWGQGKDPTRRTKEVNEPTQRLRVLIDNDDAEHRSELDVGQIGKYVTLQDPSSTSPQTPSQPPLRPPT